MSRTLRCAAAWLLLALLVAPLSLRGSAYNGRPKLVVIIVIDQFRGDYLERYRDRFTPGGFRLLMDRGADFTDCYYDYATTMTAPGHATLGTGAYSDGHGINNNEWWDPGRKRVVTSVQDANVKIIGTDTTDEGASPHNLLADTIGDELRLATGGRSRVFGVSLKDRAAILPVGHSANAAFWLDHRTGAFVTSSYYSKALPEWAQKFNANQATDKYWDLDWKDAGGKTLRSTTHKDASGKLMEFYDVVGATPYANDYQFEFVRELITNEKLGQGDTTDLLVISLSSFDILGHKVGPDSPEMAAMTLAVDKQLADFFSFLGRQVGLANTWIALSADHGSAPMTEYAKGLHLPAARINESTLPATLSAALGTTLGKPGDYVKFASWPAVYLSEDAFMAVGKSEAEAERLVGEALMKTTGARSFYGKAQLSTSTNIENSQIGRRFQHSYSPAGSWYVLAVPPIFLSPYASTTTEHYSPYNYNTHVPLLLYGLPFQPGIYRTHAEPVDLAPTLASLLGINRPTHAVGRVLTEAIRDQSANADGDKGPK